MKECNLTKLPQKPGIEMPCRQDNDPVGEWNSQSIYTVSMYKYIHWRTKDWNNLQILLLWKEIGTFIHQSGIQLITMYCQEINNVKHYYYNLNFFSELLKLLQRVLIKKSSTCSNDSFADPWHSSCQFV